MNVTALLPAAGHHAYVPRAMAICLALVVGGLGAQWFYLGNRRRGWIYIATLPLMAAPVLMSWFDAVRFVWMDRREFDARCVSQN